ncbi:MAG: hypothetical protein JNM56_18975 [Planctomycetia bacterium]|nr:hypothetical protein [Planctomycetia bacterium]
MAAAEAAPTLPATESAWRLGLTWYVLSSAVVVVGVVGAFPQFPDHPWYEFFARWDGTHYARICREGYFFDPTRESSVAFLPLYPLAALPLIGLGLPVELALTVVSNLAYAASFVLLALYVRERWPDAVPGQVHATLIAFGFLPPSFYFRMAYSEALFVLCTLLLLLAIQRQYSVWTVALLAGLACGVRIVGVALLPVVLLYAWRQVERPWPFLWRALGLIPLSCLGLLGFMVYTGIALGEPFAFLKNIQHWAVADPERSKFISLLTLQPFWRNLDPSSPCYYAGQDASGYPWAGLMLGNPVWFGLAALLLLWGAYRRLLNPYETLLAAGLWLVPYITRCHDLCMGAAARYAAAIVPVYLLVGILCARVPTWTGFALVILAASLLVAYSFRFALWGAWFF